MRRILLSAGIESEGDLRRLVEVAKRNNPSIRDQHSSSREESPEDETSKRMRSVAESVGVRDERDLRDLVQAALANQRGPASSGKRPSQQGSSSSSTEKRRKMTPSSADAKSSTTSSTGLLRDTDSRKEDTPYTMQLSNREKRRKEAPSPAGTRASITGSAGLLGDRASITGSAGLLGDRASITGSAGLLGDRASITGSAGLLGDRASITGSAGLLGDRASITDSAGLLGDRASITSSAGLLGDRDTRNEDTPYTMQPSPAWPAGSSLPQGKVQPLLSPDVIEVARIRKRKMELLAEQARLEEEERQLMQLKDGRMDNKNTMKPTEGGNGRQLDLLESRREEARRKLLEIESKDRPRPAREDDRGRESRGRSRDIGTPQEKKREDKDRRSSGQRKRSRFDSPLRDVKNETRTHSRERERYMDERGRSQRDLNPRKLDKSNLPQEGNPTREYRSGRMERERARHIDEQGRSQRNLNLQKLDERDLPQAGSSTREYGSEREQLRRDIHQQGRSRLQEEPAERWRERYSPGLQDKDRMEHLRTGWDADSGRDPQLGDSQVEGKYISPEEEEKNRKLELQKEAKKRLQAYARTAQQKLEGQKRMEQKRKEIKQLQKEWARQHAEATKKAEKKLQMEYTEFLSSLDTSEGKKEEVEEESHVTAEELELAKMTAQQFGISDVPLALEALKLMKELDASGYEDLVEFGDLLGRLARGELEVMDIADILPPRVAELITSGKLKPQLIDTLVQISKQTAADNGVEDSDRGKEEQRTSAQRGGSWQGKTSRASSRSKEGAGSSLPPETKALDKCKLFVHKIPKGTTHYQLLRLFPRATRIDYPKTRSAALCDVGHDSSQGDNTDQGARPDVWLQHPEGNMSSQRRLCGDGQRSGGSRCEGRGRVTGGRVERRDVLLARTSDVPHTGSWRLPLPHSGGRRLHRVTMATRGSFTKWVH